MKDAEIRQFIGMMFLACAGIVLISGGLLPGL